MALPGTLIWEVRPTNGTTEAGGGFDPSVTSPGTDYSQQNAVQVAYTDLVIGVTTTDLTSVATPFTSAHVGNNIAIISGTGFTTGIYNIRSVTATVATMDRSVGTTLSTGGTGNLGGARSGFMVGTNTLAAQMVAGNKVWVKNEAWNEAVVCAVNGAAGNPNIIEGYNTARGDSPTDGSRPLNDRASAGGTAIAVGAGYFIKNIMSTRAGTIGFSCTKNTQFINCRSYNNGTSGFVATVASNISLLSCEADTNASTGVQMPVSVSGSIIGCSCHNNTSNGIDASTSNMVITNCLIYANSATGIITSGTTINTYIAGNTIYGNTGGTTDGIAFTTPTTSAIFINNIVANNGRYGINATDGDSIWSDYNCFNGNSTAARNNVPTGPNDTTVSPQFINAGSGNFAIGKNLRALGFPSLLPAGLTTSYVDIGAAQRQEPGDASYGFVT